MKRSELIYREILYQAIEKKNRVLTQADLSRNLSLSLSTVNNAINQLRKMGAVAVKQRNFHIVDIKKILYYWASIRNVKKDLIYSTRADLPVKDIEKLMPNNIVFAAYTAYKLKYDDVPADYSEVYVYGDEEGLEDLKQRFPQKKEPHNLFVLEKDESIESYGKIATIANMFVDLWNLKEWYAKEFVKEMEKKLNGILE